MKLNHNLVVAALFVSGILGACNSSGSKKGSGSDSTNASNQILLDSAAFNATKDSLATHLYILKNKSGMQAAITNYGGRVVSLLVKDKNDQWVDVVLGHDSLRVYLD